MFVFIVCQVEEYQKILKLSWKPLAFTSYKAFLKKQKEVCNQAPYPIFCVIFEYVSCYIVLTDRTSLSGCLYFVIQWVICVLNLFVTGL